VNACKPKPIRGVPQSASARHGDAARDFGRGSGVQLDTGDPLLTEQDFGGEVELQALKIRNGGEVRGTRLEQSAALARAKGDAAMTGSYFRAGSLLVGGADGPTTRASITRRRYGIEYY
jgi:hypothetical protein